MTARYRIRREYPGRWVGEVSRDGGIWLLIGGARSWREACDRMAHVLRPKETR